MKEDAQLVCPIGYEDPFSVFTFLEKDLIARFPIENLLWTNPITQQEVKIGSLPLRCLPMNANLFKDTDHPFRWFLAPYVDIYVFVCEGLDVYKSYKPKLKVWIDSQNAIRRTSWLILFLPMGSQPMETYQRIYSKIGQDFYIDKPGDRCHMLLLSGLRNTVDQSQHQSQPIVSPSSIFDLTLKLRECIMHSIQARILKYDAEIRRVEGTKTSPSADFRQVFLVKESLALMYQMMQMPSYALMQYDEIQELLLDKAPVNLLPLSYWPLITTENIKVKNSGKKSPRLDDESADPISKGNAEVDEQKNIKNNVFIRHLEEAVTNGQDILVYSINSARMKVLKNKISLMELQAYVFARRCFFLLWLEDIGEFADLGLKFLKVSAPVLIERLNAMVVNFNDSTGTTLSTIGLVEDRTEFLRSFLKESDIRRAVDLWTISAACSFAQRCCELSVKSVKPLEETDLVDIETERSRCQSILCDILRLAGNRLQGLSSTSGCRIREAAVLTMQAAEMLTVWDAFPRVSESYPEMFRETRQSTLTDNSSKDAFEVEGADFTDSLKTFAKVHGAILEAKHMQLQQGDSEVERRVVCTTGGVVNITDEAVIAAEVDALVVFLRFQAAVHELLGRSRYCLTFKLRCADVLMCNGQFKGAIKNLQAAFYKSEPPSALRKKDREAQDKGETARRCNGVVDLSSILLQAVFRAVQDDNFTRSDSSYVQHGRVDWEVFGDWLEIRYWILRKLMLCARAVGDTAIYVKCVLELLLPVIRRSPAPPLGLYSGTLAEDWFRDVLSLIGGRVSVDNINSVVEHMDSNSQDSNLQTEVKIGAGRTSSKPGVSVNMCMRPFLETSISVDCNGDNCKLSFSPLVIEGEVIQGRVLSWDAGRPIHVLRLHIRSHLPTPVVLDDICVRYVPISPTMFASTSSDSSTLGNDAVSDGGFTCRAATSCAPLLLVPTSFDSSCSNGDDNSLIVPLVLEIPSAGSFAAVSCSIRVGNLNFSEHINSSGEQFSAFFRNYTLLSVALPTKPMRFEFSSPQFTPCDQEDSVQVLIECGEPGDKLLNCSFHASTSVESTTGFELNQKTIVTVSSSKRWTMSRQNSSVECSVDDTQQSILISALNEEGSSGALVIDVPFTASKKIEFLTSPSKQQQPIESQQLVRSISNSALGTPLSDLKNDGGIIKLAISGAFLRRQCRINFSQVLYCAVTTGHPISTKIIATPYLRDFNKNTDTKMVFFNQIIFKNCSPVSWFLSNLRLIRSIPGVEVVNHVGTLMSGNHSSDSCIEMQPGEEYCDIIHFTVPDNWSVPSNIDSSEGVRVYFDLNRTMKSQTDVATIGPTNIRNAVTKLIEVETNLNEDRRPDGCADTVDVPYSFDLASAAFFNTRLFQGTFLLQLPATRSRKRGSSDPSSLNLQELLEVEAVAQILDKHRVSNVKDFNAAGEDSLSDTDGRKLNDKVSPTIFQIGVPLTCRYSLLLRPTVAGNFVDRTGAFGYDLCISPREEAEWAVMGHTSKIIRFSGQQMEVSLETQLAATTCGILVLPPLEVRRHSSNELMQPLSTSVVLTAHPETRVLVESTGEFITYARPMSEMRNTYD